jgi:AcrR family transcriptional regulator
VPRKPHADSADTIERILAAAQATLETDELAGISLRKVARRAGVSASTVTYYFSTADVMWEACLEAHFGRVIQFAAPYWAEVEAGAAVSGVLARAAYEGYYFALQERTMLRLLLAWTARRGGLTGRHREQTTSNLRMLATRWTQPENVTRVVLAVQSLCFAYSRFACASVEDRLALTGEKSVSAADKTIAEQLTSFAVSLMLPTAS